MRHFITICAISAALTQPAHAEDDSGPSLMEQGAELFLEGLRKEMEPAFDELLGLADQFGPAMQSFMAEMGPALADLAAEIEDWSTYEVPEILPNGDIIIRKKPETPEIEPVQPQDAPEGEIDI
ncbi:MULTISPECIES: hypothetical protein [unclassified Ruegeria]|uniref:hypothetical protein n=1 Tax=unclassified Ruegeria TaxID=2625375 RepID=UPI001ADC29FA|nr:MULTISPECIES: hypothetical protein [unclassified Ruegeria]MBO9411232.1 hypothetical protein [Ruegeria sp. R8_1]MBO9415433.1 hypothetical protein [Ruegeria sp. R8_2]